MVILAVNIIGNGTADGDESGARSDGNEPSLRKKYFDDVRKTDAAFAAQHSGGFVETKNTVESAAIDQFASRIETGVAITSPEAIRQQGTGCCRS